MIEREFFDFSFFSSSNEINIFYKNFLFPLDIRKCNIQDFFYLYYKIFFYCISKKRLVITKIVRKEKKKIRSIYPPILGNPKSWYSIFPLTVLNRIPH